MYITGLKTALDYTKNTHPRKTSFENGIHTYILI